MKTRIFYFIISLLSVISFFSCEEDDEPVTTVQDYYINTINVQTLSQGNTQTTIEVTALSNWNNIELKLTSVEFNTQETFLMEKNEDMFRSEINFIPQAWSEGEILIEFRGINNAGNIVNLGITETYTLVFGETLNTFSFELSDDSVIESGSAHLVLDYEKECSENCGDSVRFRVITQDNTVLFNEELLVEALVGSIDINITELSPGMEYELRATSVDDSFSNLPMSIMFETLPLNTIGDISVIENYISVNSAELLVQINGNPTIGGSITLEVVDMNDNTIYTDNEVLSMESQEILLTLDNVLSSNTEYELRITNVTGSTLYDELDFSYSFQTLGGIFDTSLSVENISPSSFDVDIIFTNTTGQPVDLELLMVPNEGEMESRMITLPVTSGLGSITEQFQGFYPEQNVTLYLNQGSTTLNSITVVTHENEYTNISVTAGDEDDQDIIVTPSSNQNIIDLSFESLAETMTQVIMVKVKPESGIEPWERFLLFSIGGETIATNNQSNWGQPDADGYYTLTIQLNSTIAEGLNSFVLNTDTQTDDDPETDVLSDFIVTMSITDAQGKVIESQDTLLVQTQY